MRGQVFGYTEALSIPVLSFSLPKEERLSNARLIAAAPELLEALKECRTDLMIAAGNADYAAKTDTKWEGVGDKLRDRASKADAAIANVEGRDNG
jgi:hypothetical protein